MSDSATMTVEVPVVVEIDFDEPFQVADNMDLPGVESEIAESVIRHRKPPAALENAVTERLSSPSVSVRRVYLPNGYTITPQEEDSHE